MLSMFWTQKATVKSPGQTEQAVERKLNRLSYAKQNEAAIPSKSELDNAEGH